MRVPLRAVLTFTTQIQSRPHKVRVQSPRTDPQMAGVRMESLLGTYSSVQLGYKSEAPTNPSFNDLLERLTELREALYLLLVVYYKGHN